MTHDAGITDEAVGDQPTWSAPVLRRLEGAGSIVELPGSGLDGGQDSNNAS